MITQSSPSKDPRARDPPAPSLFSSYVVERLIDASVVGIWIFLSGTMVFYNKYLLSYFGFYFPISVRHGDHS